MVIKVVSSKQSLEKLDTLKVMDSLNLSSQFSYRGGPIITKPQIFVLFCGQWWKKKDAGQHRLIFRILNFYHHLLDSSFIDNLSLDYSTDKYKIERGRKVGSHTIVDLDDATVTDQQIREVLNKKFTTDWVIKQRVTDPANTLFVLYFQPGTTVIMDDGARSCEVFCGYHDYIPDSKLYYSVIPFASCSGCQLAGSTFDGLTTVVSHEVAEWITDPIPGSGWYNDIYGEVGDVCESRTKEIDTYVMQKIWSNSKRRCI